MSYGGGGYGGYYGGGYDVGRYRGGGYDDRVYDGRGRHGGGHHRRSHGHHPEELPEYEKDYRETMGLAKRQLQLDETVAKAVIYAPLNNSTHPSPFPRFKYILRVVLTQIYKVRLTAKEAAQIKYREAELEAKKVKLDATKAKHEEMRTDYQGNVDRAKAKLKGGEAKAVGGTGGEGAPSEEGNEA